MNQTKENIRKSNRESKITSKIWKEIPTDENPYIASQCICHGYNMSDLYSNVDYISMLYLLFKGELPTKRDKELLNTLMVGCLNMGPRNVGVRSAMSASMSRTKLHNLLPIGINLSSQQCNIVSEAMKFIKYGFKGNVIDYESVGFKVNTHGRNEYFNSMAEYIVNKYDSDIFLNTKKFIKRENLS